MSDYATQIVAAKMQQLNTRINVRMQEISDHTGIQFSEMFAQKINSAVQVDGISDDTPEYTDEQAADSVNETSVSGGAGTQRNNYDSLISEAAEKYGLEYQLIRAVMWAESNFNPNAVSSAGAMGLMQLMPATAKMLGVDDAFDPQQNVDGGVRFLAARIKDYDGDILKALASYNCGAGGLSSRGITDLTDPEQFAKLPKETQTYLTRIEGYLESVGVSSIFS